MVKNPVFVFLCFFVSESIQTGQLKANYETTTKQLQNNYKTITKQLQNNYKTIKKTQWFCESDCF